MKLETAAKGSVTTLFISEHTHSSKIIRFYSWKHCYLRLGGDWISWG